MMSPYVSGYGQPGTRHESPRNERVKHQTIGLHLSMNWFDLTKGF